MALDAGVRCKPEGENREGENREGGKKISGTRGGSGREERKSGARGSYERLDERKRGNRTLRFF